MPLLDLAPELLFLIAENLKPRNLSLFLRANKQLSILLTPALRKLACKEKYATAALFGAAALGNEEMVRLLLQKGEGIKIIDIMPNKDKILFTAPQKCSDEVIQFVLGEGANLVLEDRRHLTDESVVWNKVRQDRRTPATGRAVYNSESDSSDDEVPGSILDNKSKSQPSNLSGVPEICFADNFCSSLLKYDFECFFTSGLPASQHRRFKLCYSSVNKAALDWSVHHRHHTLLRTLLRTGANTEFQNKAGRTPLSEAAFRCNEAAVKILLENGAKTNALDPMERTPLHHAAEQGSNEAVRLLLKYDADPLATDRFGVTTLELAEDGGLDSTLLREQYNARAREKEIASKAFCSAITQGDVALAAECLKKGCKPDNFYSEHPGSISCFERAIVTAARQGNKDMVGLLLENGARDFRDQIGRGARHIVTDRADRVGAFVTRVKHCDIPEAYMGECTPSEYSMSDVEVIYSDVDSDYSGSGLIDEDGCPREGQGTVDEI